MKKEYIKPESMVETIIDEDIIATSGNDGIDGQSLDETVGYGEFAKQRVDFSDSESIW